MTEQELLAFRDGPRDAAGGSHAAWLADLRREWRSGWGVVLSSAVGLGSTSTLLAMTAGLFMVPMAKELHLARSAVAVGPISQLVQSFACLFAGAIVARWGARRVAMIGVMAMAAAYLCLAFLPLKLVILYTVIVGLGLVAALTNPVAYSKGVASWFSAGLGGALAFMMSGVTAVSAVVIPVLTFTIADHGWRAGYLVLAGVDLLALPFLIKWFVDKDWRGTPPREASTGPGASMAAIGLAFKNPSFAPLGVAVLLAAVPVGGFLTNLAPLLVDQHRDHAVIAALGSIYVVAVGLGRVVIGAMLDRLKPALVTSGCFLAAAAGATLLALGSAQPAPVPVLGLSVSLIGLAQGAEADILPFYCIRLFGRALYARILGILLAIYAIAMACGGILFSLARDLTGDYSVAIVVAAVLLFLAAVLVFQVKLDQEPTA